MFKETNWMSTDYTNKHSCRLPPFPHTQATQNCQFKMVKA